MEKEPTRELSKEEYLRLLDVKIVGDPGHLSSPDSRTGFLGNFIVLPDFTIFVGQGGHYSLFAAAETQESNNSVSGYAMSRSPRFSLGKNKLVVGFHPKGNQNPALLEAVKEKVGDVFFSLS